MNLNDFNSDGGIDSPDDGHFEMLEREYQFDRVYEATEEDLVRMRERKDKQG